MTIVKPPVGEAGSGCLYQLLKYITHFLASILRYSKEEEIKLQEFQQRNFTFLINEHPVINGFKCLFTEDGFSRMRINYGFPPILLVKEPKVYVHGNLENNAVVNKIWPGCP
ncbi:dol-P-Man:Man(7)GlcNAc(2)-PP-Dol alpha-16-mannosyltransferase-like [Trifolium medium]|uniref:Dol-P-Man:Man(7)GlcNAc(2)-PP-Dol alpha-16-mannosyltransferase-like n=1 Tax=Trifolium medium TaxID=97028 RepID=A0A392MR29_9FABA|nr:dol-P-Man:Man(7)GlcNAc(2)-PP-Dol alpha-16-mannosyltransferase-like [Trifolium medium]